MVFAASTCDIVTKLVPPQLSHAGITYSMLFMLTNEPDSFKMLGGVAIDGEDNVYVWVAGNTYVSNQKTNSIQKAAKGL
jgi:hypothetical protein